MGCVPEPCIAAILYEPGDPIDTLMATAADRLHVEGFQVGGLVQHKQPGLMRCSFELEDVITSTRYPLTQLLGSASRSCALDVSALADAASVLRRAVATRVQLVIVNRFGSQEALGRGLREEMMHVAMEGIPILTAVGRRYLPQWREFTGPDADLLPLSLTVALDWCRHRISSPHSFPHSESTAFA